MDEHGISRTDAERLDFASPRCRDSQTKNIIAVTRHQTAAGNVNFNFHLFFLFGCDPKYSLGRHQSDEIVFTVSITRMHPISGMMLTTTDTHGWLFGWLHKQKKT